MERSLITNMIYNMDCVDGMKMIADKTIDLIITDPPFAIDFKGSRSNYNREKKHVIQGYNDIKQQDYYQFSHDWMKQAYRILEESGSMFVFSGWTNLRDILNALHDVGFELVNDIVWKYQFGVVTSRRFVTSHYHCLYVCKNDTKRKFYKDSRYIDGRKRYEDLEDVWIIKREYWKGIKKTPTKLPKEIIKKILQYTSQEGDLVFDPFLGSGQVAVLSKEMNRKYTGFEIIREYYDFALSRIKNTKPQLVID